MCMVLRTLEEHFPNLPGLQEEDNLGTRSFAQYTPPQASPGQHLWTPELVPQLDRVPEIPPRDIQLSQIETKHYSTPEQHRYFNPGQQFGFDVPEAIPHEEIPPPQIPRAIPQIEHYDPRDFQPQIQIENPHEILNEIRTLQPDNKSAQTAGIVLGIAVVLFLVMQNK